MHSTAPVASAIGSRLSASLVVVLPIFNEEASIARVISGWSRQLSELRIAFQILALDDGSQDKTSAILESLERQTPATLVVVNKTNSGHGPTCRLGYDIACHSPAEWVLQIDSDGQCNPKYFAGFWNDRDNYDCIFGLRESRDDGLSRRLTSFLCRAGSSLICGRDLRDANVPYRLIRTSVLRPTLTFIPPTFNIHNVALTCVLKRLPDVRWKYVPIHFPQRQGGENSMDLMRAARWGIEMLRGLTELRTSVRHDPLAREQSDDNAAENRER